MKIKIIIPKGFELKIASWENDGVSYDTVTTIGLTEVQVRFILNVANCFNYKSEKMIYLAQSIQQEQTLFKLLLKENQQWIGHPQYEEIKQILPNNKKDIHKWFYKHILSVPCLNPYGYCRAFSNFQVNFNPVEKILMFRGDYDGKPNCVEYAERGFKKSAIGVKK